MEAVLNRAQQNGRPIEMIYQGSDGQITQRVVVIKRVTATHVLAYCALRKQYRQFAIKRILAVDIGRSYRVREHTIMRKDALRERGIGGEMSLTAQ